MSVAEIPTGLHTGSELARHQTRMLELLASGAEPSRVLDALVTGLEELMPGSLCSILLVDAEGRCLLHGAAPQLPVEYTRAVHGIEIGPMAGSCGSAAFHRETVVVADIASDERWTDFRAAALPSGLRSCWSSPIQAPDGSVLGTFAVYHRYVHEPRERETSLLAGFTALAAIAIQHARLYGAVLESEERFRLCFEDSAAGVAILDLDGCCVRLNDALAELLGHDPEAIAGVPIDRLVAAADAQAVRDALGDLLEGRAEARHFEARFGDANAQRWGLVALGIARRPDGEPLCVCLNVADVTERREVESERRARRVAEAAQSVAESASRAKTEFLSALSHELRAPLSAIIGFAELLGSIELSADRRATAVDRIRCGASHIRDLVDDLLDVAAIESGAKQVNVDLVRVDELLADVMALLEPLAADRAVTLSLGATPPAKAVAEARRLKQVLINVVSNAIKFNRPGGKVEARLAPGPDRLKIEVIDDGPGIAGLDETRVFSPFDRHGAEASGTPGTGLGLCVSQQLVEAMGGCLSVRSEPGAGTTVTIVLPGGPAAG